MRTSTFFVAALNFVELAQATPLQTPVIANVMAQLDASLDIDLDIEIDADSNAGKCVDKVPEPKNAGYGKRFIE